ncbi:MAG: helix-turn-helix domain-containing protein [Syntrophobacteraceae bacterium]|jgi:hypothetical protein
MSVKLAKVDTVQRRLLPYCDAAAYLGLSVKTLRNKISLGVLPFRPRRIASKPLFDIRDLDAFCDALGHEDGTRFGGILEKKNPAVGSAGREVKNGLGNGNK